MAKRKLAKDANKGGSKRSGSAKKHRSPGGTTKPDRRPGFKERQLAAEKQERESLIPSPAASSAASSPSRTSALDDRNSDFDDSQSSPKSRPIRQEEDSSLMLLAPPLQSQVPRKAVIAKQA
jgi:hypothetical protein